MRILFKTPGTVEKHQLITAKINAGTAWQRFQVTPYAGKNESLCASNIM